MRLDFIQYIIDSVRIKYNIFDYLYNLKIKDTYRIIPIGSFCLPRVITTYCHLKRLKCFGEKTYPFDLAFFNNFDKLTELIDTHFKDFYNDIEIKNNIYVNNRFSALFNHDSHYTLEEFKQKYDARINNLYEAMEDISKTLYFIYAGFVPLTEAQTDNFIKVIEKYRTGNFKIILLECNCQSNIKSSENIMIINDIDMESLNNKGNWAKRLKTRNIKNDKEAKKIYKYLNCRLKEFIK